MPAQFGRKFAFLVARAEAAGLLPRVPLTPVDLAASELPAPGPSPVGGIGGVEAACAALNHRTDAVRWCAAVLLSSTHRALLCRRIPPSFPVILEAARALVATFFFPSTHRFHRTCGPEEILGPVVSACRTLVRLRQSRCGHLRKEWSRFLPREWHLPLFARGDSVARSEFARWRFGKIIRAQWNRMVLGVPPPGDHHTYLWGPPTYVGRTRSSRVNNRAPRCRSGRGPAWALPGVVIRFWEHAEQARRKDLPESQKPRYRVLRAQEPLAPLFVTTYGGTQQEIFARELAEIRGKQPALNPGPKRRRLRGAPRRRPPPSFSS